MFWELPGFRKSHARTHCTPKALPATPDVLAGGVDPAHLARVHLSRVAGVTGVRYSAHRGWGSQ